MRYAAVRLLNAPYGIDKEYDYNIPLHLDGKIKEGGFAVVPFGGANTAKNALVVKIKDESEYNKTKPVIALPKNSGGLNGEMLGLCEFISEHFFCPFGDAVKCILPSGFGIVKSKIYKYSEKKEVNDDELNGSAVNIIERIKRDGECSSVELKKAFGEKGLQCAASLEKLGVLTAETDYECVVNEKNEKYVRILPESEKTNGIKLTPKQSDALETLILSGEDRLFSELVSESGVSASVIKELAKKKLVEIYSIKRDRAKDVFDNYQKLKNGDFELSDEQKTAYDKLVSLYEAEEAKAALLYGITGSGKTNVIMKLMEKVLSDGKNIIVLVPEIALTSQTVGRFASKYKDYGIALIHSGLSSGEKSDAWKKIKDGEARIVIGTRSAIFAPLDNIGLIVMDEEQDASFKSDRSPKYHTRDVAKYRCVYNKALFVMASATPSIESFYNAKSGRYELIELKNRYGGAKLPEVEFYDMKNEPFFMAPDDAFHGFSDEKEEKTGEKDRAETEIPLMIGEKLKDEIAHCLDRKEQAIIFINRRGYRAFAMCRNCGEVFACPNCSVSLTYHKYAKGKNRMVCHYCGYSSDVPEVCAKCGKDRISFVGSGTQLLEETLSKQFEGARVLRMDADTTTGKYSHEKILSSFRNGKADILVGTQMVAKGHDFPKVSLVGVALADTSLFVNDFKANEKTFSLLTQVLGRAGRADVPGLAVIQTYSPDNEVFRYASLQDYDKFYESEINFRKSSVFPPFCDIITVGFSGSVETDVINAARNFGMMLDEAAKNVYKDAKFILFGPFRNEIYKLAGKYRVRYIIKCRNGKRIRQMLSELIKTNIPKRKNVSVYADVNPTNL
ncbi:MAG: primosomal protein N' [Clostridiales bacterium]|nr:primosomal protein N' [Clostridiales bacterium]